MYIRNMYTKSACILYICIQVHTCTCRCTLSLVAYLWLVPWCIREALQSHWLTRPRLVTTSPLMSCRTTLTYTR